MSTCLFTSGAHVIMSHFKNDRYVQIAFTHGYDVCDLVLTVCHDNKKGQKERSTHRIHTQTCTRTASYSGVFVKYNYFNVKLSQLYKIPVICERMKLTWYFPYLLVYYFKHLHRMANVVLIYRYRHG